jgi:hypothetical protein
VSADSRVPTAAAPAITPLPERAAIAILGSMVFLILLLMAILVQTTWVDPANASETPAVESADFAQR